ncbi:thermonuclease family protein [Prochlorococcus marinus]|uniref:thermonuclease family protein n=1 Tax=Prochlorococcus marinus TaxID=1219 RepID=UPI001FD6FF48|nr:thermonuclease family protein [Prochlorococcus marinus]
MKVILLISLSLFYTSEIHPKLTTTIIINCYDGDTCTTIEGEKIRLACIDTPELKGKNANPIAAKEARDFLNNLVTNEEIYIKRIAKDRYGRTVAELFKNDINVQEIIVKKRYGKIYKRYADQCEWTQKEGLN